MSKETKSERFVRIIENRVNDLLKQIDSLGRCSATATYEYTDEQVDKVFTAIYDRLCSVRKKFNNPTQGGNERFVLSCKNRQSVSERYPSIMLGMPDGSKLIAAAIQDENFPAINLYLVRNGSDDEEQICFAEYNPERQGKKGICIGVYNSAKDDPVYYDNYIAEEEKDEDFYHGTDEC